MAIRVSAQTNNFRYEDAYSDEVIKLYPQATALAPELLTQGPAETLTTLPPERQTVPSADEMKQAAETLHAEKTKQGYRINLQADVLFDFDKAEIKPEAEESLKQVSVLIAGIKVKDIRIDGYTDSKGSVSYNQALSERRAKAVATWLVNVGNVKPDLCITHGLGKSHPAARETNNDGSDYPEGRAKNRRVEIFIDEDKTQ